jgi:integrase
VGRAPNPIPSYLRHRQSGKARIIVRDHVGAAREILLPGAYNSKESLEEYHRLCGLLRANGGRLPATKCGTVDLTVSELVLRYMDEHVTVYYVDPDTKQETTEVECLRGSFRPLKRLFGEMAVVEFDSLKLEALQAAMASGTWLTEEEAQDRRVLKKPVGMARTTVNRHIDRVKRLFRWGCAKKLVPADNLVNLETVPSLKQGRCAARETKAVTPIDPEVVTKTLPHLPPVPADMVRLLLLSGARVGELCRLRGGDLDRSGPVWLYRVPRHKNRYRGHTRTVAFGPKAQLVLARYLKDDPGAYLFSPAEQALLRRERMRKDRKTPVQPSQKDRRRKNPKRKPGAAYNPQAVGHAITRACKKAGVPHWHVHQLRHTAALLVMREYGVEAARSVLGHKTLNMTLHYSGIDLERAKEVAARIG